jgi:transposase
MSILSIEAFYGQSIGLNAPWKEKKVSIDGDNKQVIIEVECPRGTAWVDPQTLERAEIKDWQLRTWRHFDTCEYETIITAEVPRVKLKNGRTMVVRVPWAESGGRFTMQFESYLIELLLACQAITRAQPQRRQGRGYGHVARLHSSRGARVRARRHCVR